MGKSLILTILLLVMIFGVSGCDFARTNPADPGGENFQFATIEGTVISTTGLSLEGVEVRISGENSSTTTDEMGKYSIPDILGGKTYTVTASKGGYSQESKKDQPKAGEISIVDFELRDIDDPIINHTPITEANLGTGIEIIATVKDNEKISKALLFYKRSTDSVFTEASLEEKTKDIYTGSIPSEVVVGAGVKYHIFVVDAAGNSANSGSDDKPHNITVLVVFINIFTPTDGSITNTATQKVRGEVEVGATLTINGTSVEPDPLTGEFSHTVILVEGKNTITVIATKAGKTTTIARTVTFIPSDVKLTVSSPEDGVSTNSSTLTVAGNAEVGSTVTVNDLEVSLDDNGDFSRKLPLEEGANTITVIAKDKEGNQAKITLIVFLDTIAPDAPVMTAKDEYTQGASNTVSWGKVTGASGYYVEYDNSDTFSSPEENSGWIGGTSHTFSLLSDGQKYYYRVKARDLAMNENDPSVPVSSTQDNTPPDTSVNALAIYQNTLTFDVAYTADDGTSGVKHVELYYKKDGGDWTKYGSTYTSSPISFDSSTTGDGVYEFYTIGTDNVDNVEIAPASSDAGATVDTMAPTVTSTSPAADATGIDVGTSITATFNEPMDATK